MPSAIRKMTMKSEAAFAVYPAPGRILDLMARVLSRVIGVPGVVEQTFGDGGYSPLPDQARQGGGMNSPAVRFPYSPMS
jgi:hypothetical protein